MTSTLRAFAAVSTAAALLALAACSSGASPESTDVIEVSSPIAADGACADDGGVTLVVDSSALPDGSVQEWCDPADAAVAASDVLADAAVVTEGTADYPEDVVCRVNGAPFEDVALTAEDGTDYFETCDAMPPAFAYWSLWIKPAGGEWDYAQEGLSTLQVEPGDAIELLFTLDGEPAAPAS